jgi:hypothetical protein
MEELVMTRKLALFIIIPSLFWLITNTRGYSQNDLNNEYHVVPLYFSYTNNVPVSIGQPLMLEHWMLCDMGFEKPEAKCFYLEDWMLNGLPILAYDSNDLEDWMLGDVSETDVKRYEMKEWMFGFEPMVEASLYRTDLADDLEDWMLKFSTAQMLLEEVFISVTDWMLDTSFDEHESALDLEDWMVDGLSMN